MESLAQDQAQCPNRDVTSKTMDTTWLLHRAAQRLRIGLDAAAHRFGLADSRDWAVLTAIKDGGKRPQLAIGNELGLDKTTLTSILDRLERESLVVRTIDPRDRRARLPEITDKGAAVQSEMASARDEFEDRLLSAHDPQEREAFLRVLFGLACPSGGGDNPVHGSCM